MIGGNESGQNPRGRRVDPRLAVVVAVVCAVVVIGWSTSWATGLHVVLGVMQLVTSVNQSVRAPHRRCVRLTGGAPDAVLRSAVPDAALRARAFRRYSALIRRGWVLGKEKPAPCRGAGGMCKVCNTGCVRAILLIGASGRELVHQGTS